jgi:two-component system, NarL family, invasion response regulator UvrY
MRIRIGLADDHAVFRQGLAIILSSGGDFLTKLDPKEVDVVCLDINMPGLSGLDLVPEIRRRAPRLPILVLSQFPERQMAVRVIRDGASGYLTKDSDPADIVTAIKRLAEGKRYFTPEVGQLLAETVGSATGPPHELLSNREMRVFLMLASGHTTGDVADKLNLSPKTVTTYRSRVMEKLGLSTNAELARYALEHSLSLD